MERVVPPAGSAAASAPRVAIYVIDLFRENSVYSRTTAPELSVVRRAKSANLLASALENAHHGRQAALRAGKLPHSPFGEKML